MYKNEQEEIRKLEELELLKTIGKSAENDAKKESAKNSDRDAWLIAWAIVTAVILIPALLLGGGLGWIFGAPILAGVALLFGKGGGGGGGGLGKKIIIAGAAGAAGYALGKKLEL
jgi:hypothetical protein